MNHFSYRNEKKKKNDDEMLLFDQDIEKIKLDESFRMDLKERIMREFENQQERKFALTSRFLIGVWGTVSIVVLILVVVISKSGYLGVTRQLSQEGGNDALTSQDRASDHDGLLIKLLSKNPSLVLDNKVYAAQNMEGVNKNKPTVTLEETPGIIGSLLDVQGFMHSRQTSQKGPAYTKCGSRNWYGLDVDTVVDEYTYMDDSSGKFTMVSIVKTKDGNLLEYTLFDDSGYLQYYGGKYAVRNNFSLPDIGNEPDLAVPDSDGIPEITSIPADTGDSPTMQVDPNTKVNNLPPEDLLNMIGYNDATVDVVSENNKDYYVVTYSEPYYCDGTSSNEDVENDVIRMWFDKKTYSLVKTEEFLGGISADNLIEVVTFENEATDDKYSDVEQYFKFPYGVEVKEVESEMPSISDEIGRIEEYLSKSSYKILMPEKGITITVMQAPELYRTLVEADPLDEYMMDRDFYADNKFGDAMYQEMVEMYSDSTNNEDLESSLPQLVYSFVPHANSSGSSVNWEDSVEITMFSSEADVSKTINDYEQWSASVVELTDRFVTVDNQKLPVVAYKISYKDDLLEEDQLDMECDGDCQERSAYLYILEAFGAKYLINTKDDVRDVPLNLMTYDMSNEVQRNKVIELYKKSFDDALMMP